MSKDSGAGSDLEALKLAMETEKRGLETYLNFAHQTGDETGKNMFILLARDELEHFEVLEKALSHLELSGRWADIEVRKSLVARVVPKLLGRDVRVKGKRGIDQVQALQAALDQERRSIELYRSQLATATDPSARKTFRKLMEMEEAHFDIIQAELDNITETGFWFQVPEFNLEEEP